jgi:beta-lactamase class A
MMVYYHLAERNPAVLRKEVPFVTEKELDITPTIVPREQIETGKVYTIEELIRRMIVFSDNQALLLLTERMPLDELRSLFSMLGVGDDVLMDKDSKLTVKEYAGFFRILFNSSYLSRENSEKALALLAQTDYHDALPAGVPSEVSVAHKFGEAGTGDVERQLHDCGIVYFSGHPYLACMMTRGHDTEVLKNSIRDISRFIYDKIDEQY